MKSLSDFDNKKKWSPVGYGSTTRSYIVETSEGKKMRRNRRHIQAVPKAVLDDILEDDILEDDILQAIPEAVPEINPETSELSRRVADRGNPEIQNTPSHTSSGRVVRKPKRKNIEIFQRY